MTSRFFTLEEFRCPCGRPECDAPSEPTVDLMDRLDRLRARLGRPVRVTSGLRCAVQNVRAGGVIGSGHLDGTEVDIAVPSSAERYEILEQNWCVGPALFERIGIGRTFLHLGVSPRLPHHVVWLY